MSDELISIDNELLRVVTRSGRVVQAGPVSRVGHPPVPVRGHITLFLTHGFVHTGQGVSIDETVVEVALYLRDEEEPSEVEHIRWAAIESVVWKGGL